MGSDAISRFAIRWRRQNDLAASQSFFSTLGGCLRKDSQLCMNPGTTGCRNHGRFIKAYHESGHIEDTRQHTRQYHHLRQPALGPGMRRGFSESDRRVHRTSPFDTLLRGHSPAVASRQRGEALKNGVALFATNYGTSSASGGGAYDPRKRQLWWNWLDANHYRVRKLVGCGLSAKNVRRISTRRRRNWTVDR